MAGPVAASIILPDDSGNTGKKVRSQTKTVGGNSVHEHFFVPGRQAVLLGVYSLAMAQQTVLQTANDGTSTGLLWFHVPTAITNKKARIRKLLINSQHSTAFAGITAPRIVASRFTFTGTASGASVTPVKVDTAWATAVADLRTAVTGLTVALVGLMGAAALVGALTAVGAYEPSGIDLIDSVSEDAWWVFAPGEGLVLWQDTAGTASDTRKINITIAWDEVDTA